MNESETELAESLASLEGVRSAVVWRSGGVPVTAHSHEDFSSLQGRMLSAAVGAFETDIDRLGFGQISQIWWQSDDAQCVGFRAGEWQVLVVAGADLGVATLRSNVAETVGKFWDETAKEDENGVN